MTKTEDRIKMEQEELYKTCKIEARRSIRRTALRLAVLEREDWPDMLVYLLEELQADVSHLSLGSKTFSRDIKPEVKKIVSALNKGFVNVKA